MKDDEMSISSEKPADGKFEPWRSPDSHGSRGMKIARHFSTPNIHPFDEIDWETRKATIADDNGVTSELCGILTYLLSILRTTNV